MNHLAHFHLAAPTEGLIVGALLADYVRGPLRGELPAGIEDGIRLHRRIDAFTDSHDAVRGLRANFGAGGRRLAGIVLDLWFDLFLARHWSRFHDTDLRSFSLGVYRVLREQDAHFPAPGRQHAQRIEQHDLLRRYAEQEVIEAALERIGTRLGLEEGMRCAIHAARAQRAGIERAFLDFYPQCVAMARERKLSAGSGNS